MLQTLRSAASKISASKSMGSAFIRSIAAPGGRPSPYRNYMCYQDGKPFMVINAPSLEHARFIVAGFSADHAWMLVQLDG